MIKEILDFLKNIERFTVTHIYNVFSNVKYKLQRTNKNITYKIIEAPKFIHNTKQEVTRSFEQPYTEIIDNFVYTMKEKLPEKSLKAMYHNLKTLKIKKSNNPIFSLFLNGSYHFFINKILLFKGNRGVATTSHELLHMSSTIIGKNNVACGFNTGVIGRNLNEGYTEVLNNRLFGHPITKNPMYNTYARFASSIEDIIGRDNMTKMYFNADLKSLFAQLSTYSSKKETSVFLKDLDSIYQFVGIGYNLSSKKIDRMLNYLVDCSIKYVDDSIKKGTLSSEEGNLFLKNYKETVYSINTYINSLISNKKTPVQNNNTEVTNNIQNEMHQNQNVNDNIKTISNNYSFNFSPDNNVEIPQLDSSKVRKKTKGNISYNLLFFLNILLSIVITISYLFIIYK